MPVRNIHTRMLRMKRLDLVEHSECFHCETHNNECPIASTAGEIKAMMETEE